MAAYADRLVSGSQLGQSCCRRIVMAGRSHLDLLGTTPLSANGWRLKTASYDSDTPGLPAFSGSATV